MEEPVVTRNPASARPHLRLATGAPAPFTFAAAGVFVVFGGTRLPPPPPPPPPPPATAAEEGEDGEGEDGEDEEEEEQEEAERACRCAHTGMP
jgi:hypothetical protein